MKGRGLPRPPRKLIFWGQCLRKPYYGSPFPLRSRNGGWAGARSLTPRACLLSWAQTPSLSPSTADCALALCKQGRLFLACRLWLLFSSFTSLGQFPERLTSSEGRSHL